MKTNNVILNSLILKFLERCGYQGIAFVIQLILARILLPSDYGVITMLTVFIAISQVFVQSGLNTALVQRKDTTEDDYTSVFWISLLIAVILYVILFFTSPLIASFYKMPELSSVLRVLALILIPGAFNSIQNAKVQREMKFKQLLYCTITAAVASGIVGITMAYACLRFWALVGQQLTNQIVVCVTLMFFIKWHPRMKFNYNRIKLFFSFGWKLLVSALIDTVYQNLTNLVVGKKYDSQTLGFYNRGNQFPNLFVTNINGSIQSVMLPALSKEQDNKTKMKSMVRRSIVTSSYILFPLLMGLAVCAEPLISLLLTEKWLPCVPYLRIFCFIYAFWPIHTANLQAINALGRSDKFLQLEIIKKIYGLIALMITVFCFKSPMAIAIGSACTAIISSFVNAHPNKKLLNYSYIEQMKDILPPIAMATIMGALVYTVTLLHLNSIITLLIQVFVGIIVYWGESKIFHIESYEYIVGIMKKIKKKKGKG